MVLNINENELTLRCQFKITDRSLTFNYLLSYVCLVCSSNVIETLLCHGLFTLCDPHKYGGRNIHTVPPAVTALAAFFRRTPGSITTKMLNLDSSRPHSVREEPLLFATLAAEPHLYHTLYTLILQTAREMFISEHILLFPAWHYPHKRRSPMTAIYSFTVKTFLKARVSIF
jgi:hypothetical protein